MTDDDLTASRAACIPDVPKILAAADRLAEAATTINLSLNSASAAWHIDKLKEAIAAYRSLRP